MIDPDAPIGLFTRIWDWLWYRPWTDDELAERVARSVANTRYRPWFPLGLPEAPPWAPFGSNFTLLDSDEDSPC